MTKILLVDDDQGCLYYLREFLGQAGHDVVTASTGAAGIAAGLAISPDVLITDWLLDGVSQGIDVAVALYAALPRMDIIFMTGLPAADIADQLQGLTDAKILEKPLSLGVLVEDILRHLAALGPRQG